MKIGLKMDKLEPKCYKFGYRKEWKIGGPYGKLHKENGPAIEWAHGHKFWYINDKRHRVDGPAIEFANGDKLWFINDKKLNKREIKIFKHLKFAPKSECLLYINTIFKPIVLNRIKNG